MQINQQYFDEEVQGPEIDEPIINHSLSTKDLVEYVYLPQEDEKKESKVILSDGFINGNLQLPNNKKEIEHRGDWDYLGYDVNKLRVGDVITCYKNKKHCTFIIRKINEKTFSCESILTMNFKTEKEYGFLNRQIRSTSGKIESVLKNKKFYYIENFDINRVVDSFEFKKKL
jgi:hypothetical protein